MTERTDIEQAVTGRRIARIEWVDRTSFGDDCSDEPTAAAVILDDSTRIELTGSPGIDEQEVDLKVLTPYS